MVPQAFFRTYQVAHDTRNQKGNAKSKTAFGKRSFSMKGLKNGLSVKE